MVLKYRGSFNISDSPGLMWFPKQIQPYSATDFTTLSVDQAYMTVPNVIWNLIK